jgi:bifunctional non-homologous end joining protein LigD
MASGGEVEVRGRRVRLTTLERVYFPSTGTTKSDLLDYYVRVGDVILAHLRERLLHMHRYPEGVTGPRFWQKGCPEHRPEWMPVAPVWSRDKRGFIDYCVLNELGALLWAVNLGSIELHTSLHRREALDRPTVIAFDLDPGPGATVLHSAEVALRVREMFAAVGLRTYAKTSGSKGLQVYLPLNDASVTYRVTKPAARRVAELLEQELPELVISRIAREARRNRVLVDWGQNTEHKSMVCASSVRARERPTVSTPVSWDEVQDALDAGEAEGLRFEMADVVERVDRLGDLFAPVLELRQELTPPGAGTQPRSPDA